MLTEEEKALLEGAAKRHGTTMSVWLRLVLRQKLGLLTAAEMSVTS